VAVAVWACRGAIPKINAAIAATLAVFKSFFTLIAFPLLRLHAYPHTCSPISDATSKLPRLPKADLIRNFLLDFPGDADGYSRFPNGMQRRILNVFSYSEG
jgi:hypothetical protein